VVVGEVDELVELVVEAEVDALVDVEVDALEV